MAKKMRLLRTIKGGRRRQKGVGGPRKRVDNSCEEKKQRRQEGRTGSSMKTRGVIVLLGEWITPRNWATNSR